MKWKATIKDGKWWFKNRYRLHLLKEGIEIDKRAKNWKNIPHRQWRKERRQELNERRRERYAGAGREWESGRAKNSRRIRPSKWAGECKSIPQRGARNCAPTLECGNPFSRALLHVLVKRRYRHQHTAYECPPRVRHCNGATAQWDRHCSGACIIASDVSDATWRTASSCAILFGE